MKKVLALVLLSSLALTACGVPKIADKKQEKDDKKKERELIPEPDKTTQTKDDATNTNKGNNDTPEGVALLWIEGIANSDAEKVCQTFSEENKAFVIAASGKSTCEEGVADEEDGLFKEIPQEDRDAMKIILPLVKPKIVEGPDNGKAKVSLEVLEDDETNVLLSVKEVNGKWYFDPDEQQKIEQ